MNGTVHPFIMDRYFKLRGEGLSHSEAIEKARAYYREVYGGKSIVCKGGI